MPPDAPGRWTWAAGGIGVLAAAWTVRESCLPWPFARAQAEKTQKRSAVVPNAAAPAAEVETATAGRSFGNGRWRVDAHAFGAPLPATDEFDVSFVAVVHRHGARTPLNKQFGVVDEVTWDVCDVNEESVQVPVVLADPATGVPTNEPAPRGDQDKNQRADEYSGGLSHRGQLSGLGFYQGVALGDWLRARYADRMSELDAEGAVRVRSSNLQRTILTAKAVLTGLFGGNIPKAVRIATVPDTAEYLYPPVKRCAFLKSQFHTAQAHIKSRYGSDATELDSGLTAHAWGNSSQDAPSPFLQLMDSAMSLSAHKKAFPEKLTRLKDDGAKLIEHSTLRSANYMAHALFADEEVAYAKTPATADGPCPSYRADLLRCSIGRVLGDVLVAMERRAAGMQDAPRMLMISGHDTTVQPLLAALSYPPASHEWPFYCGAVVFELFTSRATGEKYCRVLYRGEPLTLRDAGGNALDRKSAAPGVELVQLDALLAALAPMRVESAGELSAHCGDDASAGGGPAGSSMMKE